jgi:hypothetical protein
MNWNPSSRIGMFPFVTKSVTALRASPASNLTDAKGWSSGCEADRMVEPYLHGPSMSWDRVTLRWVYMNCVRYNSWLQGRRIQLFPGLLAPIGSPMAVYQCSLSYITYHFSPFISLLVFWRWRYMFLQTLVPISQSAWHHILESCNVKEPEWIVGRFCKGLTHCSPWEWKLEYPKIAVFWHVTLCSLVEVHWHFGGIYCLNLWGWGGGQASRVTLKMEALHSSETLVNVFQTTWHHIPEDSYWCGNLVSNMEYLGF